MSTQYEQEQQMLNQQFDDIDPNVGDQDMEDPFDQQHTVQSSTEITKFLQTGSFVVTKDDVIDMLIRFVSEIPKTAAYIEQEVVIHKFDEERIATLFGLLAAGTKPLDAILYMSLHDTDKSAIFNVQPPLDLSTKNAAMRAQKSRGVFIAWATVVITRGGNPSNSAVQPRKLPKLITERALAGLNIMNEHELTPECSSCSLTKFPSEALLEIDLANFPTEYYKRMTMSIAGSRALRDANIAAKFERVSLFSNDPTIKAKQQRAQALYKYLLNASTDERSMMGLHPMNTGNTHRIPRFTEKMTNVVLHVLTEEGRKAFAKYIIAEKMESFMKDGNIMPDAGTNRPPFSVMKRDSGDFMDVTEEALGQCLLYYKESA